MTAPKPPKPPARSGMCWIPELADWPERSARGGGVQGDARCTTRGCPARFASGPDRPCPGCRDDDGPPGDARPPRPPGGFPADTAAI